MDTHTSTMFSTSSSRRPSYQSTPTTKHDLAKAYAPDLTPRAALNRLSRWITTCQPLIKALKKTGYSVTQRNFSDKQKRLIYRYLGTP